MSEMIERVSRALHAALAGSDPDEKIHHPAQNSWEEPSWARWEQWEEAARFAIEAMREPTDEMVRQGVIAFDDTTLPELADWVRAMHQAMTDAALSTPDQKGASDGPLP